MSKVLLLQFHTDPACAARREILGNLGVTLVEDEPRWPNFFDTVTAHRPDVIVIACSLLPSYAREAARYLGEGFNTRDIPLVLVDMPEKGRQEFEDYVRRYQPRSTFANRENLSAAVKSLLGATA
jgi:hypothetical protein